MAEKQAPETPLPPPSDVPQVEVPTGLSFGALKDLPKLLASNRETPGESAAPGDAVASGAQ